MSSPSVASSLRYAVSQARALTPSASSGTSKASSSDNSSQHSIESYRSFPQAAEEQQQQQQQEHVSIPRSLRSESQTPPSNLTSNPEPGCSTSCTHILHLPVAAAAATSIPASSLLLDHMCFSDTHLPRSSRSNSGCINIPAITSLPLGLFIPPRQIPELWHSAAESQGSYALIRYLSEPGTEDPYPLPIDLNA